MKNISCVLCIFSIIVFSVFSTEVFAQPVPGGDIFFIFTQVTLRNSDGDLVTYMESDKLFDVDKKIISGTLDHFSSTMEIPIFELNDVKFQVFIVESVTEFDSATMYSNIFYNVTMDEQTIPAARFQFDGLLTSPGDEATVIWTFARVV